MIGYDTIKDMVKKEILTGILGMAAFMIYNAWKKNKNPSIYITNKLPKNFNATTIPPFGIYINESEKDNQALIKHELIHWKQYQEKGLLHYYLDYFRQLKKFGYDKMPMEEDARKNENGFCKENYTECVRDGTAKTVHNPDFRR